MYLEKLTAEDFIKECLHNVFSSVDISRNKGNAHLSDHEIGVSIWGEGQRRKIDATHKPKKMPEDLGKHRAEPLLYFIADVLKDIIPAEVDLDCQIIVNIHDDINSGAPKDRDICTMGFSGISPANTLFLPDPHYLGFLKNPIEDRADPLLFSEKKNQALFRGSDTNLQRINLSLDTLHDPFYDCKISRFIPGAFDDKYLSIDKKKISSNWFNLDKQLDYQYILDLHGWTRGWDRAYWALQSNSVLVSIIPDDGVVHHNWYSQFMYDNDIVPLVNYEEARDPNTFNSFEDYNYRQKVFSTILMSKAVASNYVGNLLIKYNALFNL